MEQFPIRHFSASAPVGTPFKTTAKESLLGTSVTPIKDSTVQSFATPGKSTAVFTS